tara:strand:+ start:1312 stop:2409 length:1098 start_codon:yes stop_codon:yes gene_type:complete
MKKYKIKYQDLSVKDNVRKKNYITAFQKIMKSGIFLMGKELNSLENKIAKKFNRKYCVGTGSGTDALYLALRALSLKKGDEIITTPLSWVSTSNAIVLNNTKPVFVDIKDDLNIDESKIERKITKNTKAILFVNFTGNSCNFSKLSKIAKKYNLKLIEDAAQSYGSINNKVKSGSMGDISCFSMNPMKVLPSLGEAGMILTNNKKYYEKIKILRYVGTVNKNNCIYPSLNFKMDTLQAAFINENLKYVQKKIKKRNNIAKIYINNLTKKIITPKIENNKLHSFYSFTILVNNRDQLMNYLKGKGIETKIQHSPLIPHQSAFLKYYKKDIPNAEKIVKKILCIPIRDDLNQKNIKYIINSINNFYN